MFVNKYLFMLSIISLGDALESRITKSKFNVHFFKDLNTFCQISSGKLLQLIFLPGNCHFFHSICLYLTRDIFNCIITGFCWFFIS